MNFKNIISITEARKNIFKIANKLEKKGGYYILTERGKAKVVMMSVKKFDFWRKKLGL